MGQIPALPTTSRTTWPIKPPVVAISLPAATIHVHYGQVVNFSGEATNLHDGTLADAKLTWTNGATTQGTGHLLTQDLLPMGDNAITLTATNSLGLHGSAVVHVIVDDNVEPDGPMMQVTPGGSPGRSILEPTPHKPESSPSPILAQATSPLPRPTMGSPKRSLFRSC
jgi:hypothetical protein